MNRKKAVGCAHSTADALAASACLNGDPVAIKPAFIVI
jgi:hypothetical protein